jgi:hypothetical protein
MVEVVVLLALALVRLAFKNVGGKRYSFTVDHALFIYYIVIESREPASARSSKGSPATVTRVSYTVQASYCVSVIALLRPLLDSIPACSIVAIEVYGCG